MVLTGLLPTCWSTLIADRDQEMRFTVHDSPDYYQLKVSVFNDDRKTEIIGETWVSLENIIAPGGGQNDLWHQLTCKGRYAGEIRIELTYYDTRPKETKSEERRQSSTVNGNQGAQRESSTGLSGPRKPKPVKRRPLPADPTVSDPSRSSPQPYTPPPSNQYLSGSQQQSPIPSPNVGLDPSAAPQSHFMQSGPRGSQLDSYHHSLNSRTDIGLDCTPERQFPNHRRHLDETGLSGHRSFDDPEQGYGAHGDQQIQSPAHFTDEPFYGDQNDQGISAPREWPPEHGYSDQTDLDHRSSGYSTHAISNAYNPSPPKFSTLPQHVSMPNVRLLQGSSGPEPLRNRSSLPGVNSYDQQLPRHHSLDECCTPYINSQRGLDDEGPPPPPAHRSSPTEPSPQPNGRVHAESYPPLAGPPPLNIRNARNSISASPLSQVQNNTPHDDFQPSVSPSTARSFPQSAPLRSSLNSYSQPDQRRSPEHFSSSPRREYNHMTPPSLIPGYDPRVAEDKSERLIREDQPDVRQSSEPVPQYQAFATHNTISRAHPTPRHEVPTQPRMVETFQDRRPHRASAPIIPLREVSPDPRTPMRKSVSPQPEQAIPERQSSAVPFGPDSYDAFNPCLNDASSINSAGPKYNTPEQSRDALHECEREAKLAEGPIIGSDGRVIDPSDHLPTETWAPEPETKAPKKKPEVTVRFRRSPAGAQPMPPSTRRTATDVPARPNPIVTPAYARSSDPISPTTNAQSRLQKKSRVAIAQPVSSPAVPTINTNTRNAGSSPNRLNYPLRENESYGYSDSPIYARNSPSSVAPPIPGKVPLSAGTRQEDWGMDALSQEMRRIDIGVGAGQGRSRRTRFGA